MSARTSRLNTLLRVRRIQEEVRRARLAAEVAAERGAERVLEQAREVYAARAVVPMVASQTLRVFIAQRNHHGALAGAIGLAGVGLDAAAEVTSVARHGWSEAAIRRRALERLEDRALDVARAERLRTEQRTSEESGTARARGGPDPSITRERP